MPYNYKRSPKKNQKSTYNIYFAFTNIPRQEPSKQKSGMWVFLYIVNLRITLNWHPSFKILSNIEPWENLAEKEVFEINQQRPITCQSQPCQCKNRIRLVHSCHKNNAPKGYEKCCHYDLKFPLPNLVYECVKEALFRR